jgi:lipoprotein-releasing system ATP-binding protein
VTDSLLVATDLHKSYEKEGGVIQVLKGADLAVSAGETVSIVGASGAGKSTLLHVLGTLDAPDQGQLTYAGRDMATLSPAELADFRNRTMGFVFQFHHLLTEFSALENVMMPALIRRMPRRLAEKIAERALLSVGLAHRLHHKPGELSGGEQQRVALARALVLTPPLILADEVTGNLDDKTGEEIHNLLIEINRGQKTTIVVVTHNRKLADRMQRRLLLEDGVLKDRA